MAFGQVEPLDDRIGYDALYQQVLNDPSNVELTLQYAQQARQRGDYEAAISAYDRLLLYNPSLSQLKYELGVLHFELESYAAARTYFEAAIAAPNAPAGMRANANSYIKEIDRRLSPTRIVAYAHAGIRHQTNASSGPVSDLIRIAGQNVSLDRAFAGRPDWNAFVLGTVNYEQDLGQSGHVFEAGLSGYYSRQNRIERVNLGAGELQAGPRFALQLDHVLGASAKVYAIAGGVTLGDRPYNTSYGAGLSFRAKPNPALVVETAFEYRARRYYDSVDYPTAAEQTGHLATAVLAGTGILLGPMRWLARIGYDWNRSDFAFWSYSRPFIDIALPTSFVVPVFGADRVWVITHYAGASLVDYEVPNPTYDPGQTRRDREWHAGLTIDAELVPNAGVRANVHYVSYVSNIVNFSFRNLAVSVGPAVRF